MKIDYHMLENLPIFSHMFICQRYIGLCSPIIIIFLCSHFSSPPQTVVVSLVLSLLYCGIFALQYKVLELNIFELVLYSTEKPFKW